MYQSASNDEHTYHGVARDELQNDDVPRPRRSSWAQEYLWSACLILATVVAVETIYLLRILDPMNTTSKQHSVHLKSPVPHMRSVIKRYYHDPQFRELDTVQAVLSAWERVLSISPSSGFVSVARPEQYGLLPNHNVLKNTTNIYMVSFYHQMHCLQQLQAAFVKMRLGEGAPEVAHIEHCFNYLRQGVMCSGDLTLEGVDRIIEPGESPIRGYEADHVCKSWEDIRDWMHREKAQ